MKKKTDTKRAKSVRVWVGRDLNGAFLSRYEPELEESEMFATSNLDYFNCDGMWNPLRLKLGELRRATLTLDPK